MPEVFLLCEYPTLSGGERSMLATLDGVRRAGIDVAVIAPPEGPLAAALAARGVEVLPFRFRDAAGRRLPQGRLREQLAQRLGRRRPGLLHANSLAMGRLSGPVVADLGLPSIAHLRDIVRLSPQAVADLNRHTRLLAVSEATRRFHAACGLDPDKTHVLHNGVELDTFQPRPGSGYLHRELGLSPEIHLVGTIGQIGLRKGQDVLLGAAALLADELPHVHYVIVGRRWSDKPESRQFETELHAAATGALAGRVHFLGYRSDVGRILGELCLLVHPARQEPLGRALLEGAASGAAVVATDVGGTPEIFPPGVGRNRPST
jgi:glycosyltransferase involved in cell wall biosynthesis